MHNNARKLIMAAGMLLLWSGLAGCDASNPVTTPPGSFTPDGRTVPAQTNLAGLQVKVSTDKTTYKVGEAIAINVAVTNTTNAARAVSFPSGSQTVWWGYMISQNGKIVSYEYWTGHKLAFTDDVKFDSYQPGETHNFPWTFPYKPASDSPPQVSTLPAGTYQVQARIPDLLFDGGIALRPDTPTPISDPVTITVTP